MVEGDGPPLRKVGVLIVDGNRHMRNILRGIVTAFGAKSVIEAADGADALRELKHFAADIVITDYAMSPIDGIELARFIRAGQDWADRFVPILMVSGCTDRRTVEAARDAGVNDFLAKPVSATSLQARLCNLVFRPRSYVVTAGYCGPDRRRRTLGWKGVERRKAAVGAVTMRSRAG
ncbi:MAG: response regulator [Alphaproteobacteria bacterium]|nr:response regulator [Alphaproteobacteria bacterium]